MPRYGDGSYDATKSTALSRRSARRWPGVVDERDRHTYTEASTSDGEDDEEEPPPECPLDSTEDNAPMASSILSLASNLTSFAWPRLVSLSRSAILGALKNIQIGSLHITDTDGTRTVCGTSRRPHDDGGDKGTVYAVPHAELRVLDDLFWVRMLVFGDMGFAESYMLGEVACPDLPVFFRLFIRNRDHLSDGTTVTSALSARLAAIARRTNTLANARLNISAHYDISNDMFAAFLSPDMTYSCPIWLPTTHADAPLDTLERAQDRKLRRFIFQARIKSTDHVLEIGTGWGSFAILAARETGCRITSLTLSAEQKQLADARIADAGLADRITVLLCDYRHLEPASDDRDRFDKIVSIEMLEAVGPEFLDTYFGCVDRLLKCDGGIAVFQCITMPESRYAAYRTSDDFIRRYIFPGGHLPTVTRLLNAARTGSSDNGRRPPRLIPESLENIGPHYTKTLRLWRGSFMRNFESDIRPVLMRDAAGATTMSDADVATFRRKWEYYFAYCEAGFACKVLGDVILTFGREGAVEMMEDVPL